MKLGKLLKSIGRIVMKIAHHELERAVTNQDNSTKVKIGGTTLTVSADKADAVKPQQ